MGVAKRGGGREWGVRGPEKTRKEGGTGGGVKDVKRPRLIHTGRVERKNISGPRVCEKKKRKEKTVMGGGPGDHEKKG